MTTDVAPLPDDPETLKAVLLAKRARSERLAQIIKELQRHRFGRRAESLLEDQLLLALEEVEQTLSEAEAIAYAEVGSNGPTKKDTKRSVNRGALPEHLPLVETIVDVKDKTCRCCGGALHPIDADRAERLDVVPAQFRVLVVRRPKYACRACEEGVVQAPAPARVIEGELPTKRSSPKCWSESMPTTCRSIDKPRSMPAKASRWIARRSPIGSGAPRRLPRHPAGRRLCGLPTTRREGGCPVGTALGAHAQQEVLRVGRRRQRADRRRDAEADCRDLPRRNVDPRHAGR